MSSSVFAKSPLSTNDSRMKYDDGTASHDLGLKSFSNSNQSKDSNLVLIYGQNGINVNQNELDHILDEKTISSISVIRIGSPTPSMEDENEKEIYKDSEKEKGSTDSDSESTKESESSKCFRTVERPEVVGIFIEDFISSEGAQQIAREALDLAGVIPTSTESFYELSRFAIKNDHCYTPYTSPKEILDATEKNHLKLKGLNLFNKQYPTLADKKILSNNKIASEIKIDAKLDIDNTNNDEFANSQESDENYLEQNYSGDTDNDRDSDLDFNVNDRNCRNKRKKIKKQRKSLVKSNFKKRNSSQDTSFDDDNNKQIFRKLNRTSVDSNKQSVPTPGTKIFNKNEKIVTDSTKEKPETRPFVLKCKTVIFSSTPSTSQKSENSLEIPGYKAISTLADLSDQKLKSNEKVPEIELVNESYADSSVNVKPVKSQLKDLMQPEAQFTADKLISTPISIQQHPCSFKMNAENDKQLDWIDSIVSSEMANKGGIEKETINETNIPDIVKMLENTEKAVMLKQANCSKALTSSFSNQVEDIDISSVPLLESNDNEFSEDLIKQVVELIEQNSNENFDNINLSTTTNISPVILASDSCYNPNIIQNTNINIIGTPSSNSFELVSKQLSVRKEPIQIVRGNGRVITLPPIEAPTTRAKRRALVQPDTNANSFEVMEDIKDFTPVLQSSHHSLLFDIQDDVKEEKTVDTNITLEEKEPKGVKKRLSLIKYGSKQIQVNINKYIDGPVSDIRDEKKIENNDEDEDEDKNEDEDDPNKLWCICRQPHNNRFMICCDKCEEWFHGACVNVTKAMGREMETKGVEWTCPNCIEPKEKQSKITDLFTKAEHPFFAPTILVNESLIHKNIENEEHEKKLIKQFSEPLFKSFEHSAKTEMTLNNSLKNDADNISVNFKPAQMDEVTIQKKIAQLTKSSNKKCVTITPNTSKQQNVVKQLSISLSKLTDESKSPVSTKQMQTKKIIFHNKLQPQPQISKFPARIEANHSFNTEENIVDKVSIKEPIICIVCNKFARLNSIYCGSDCIKKHAQNSLISVKEAKSSDLNISGPITLGIEKKKKTKDLFEEVLLKADMKPKIERVDVYERKTGRFFSGNNAPTELSLKKWLQDNPTFEVVQPGSIQAFEIEKLKNNTKQLSTIPNHNSNTLPVAIPKISSKSFYHTQNINVINKNYDNGVNVLNRTYSNIAKVSPFSIKPNKVDRQVSIEKKDKKPLSRTLSDKAPNIHMAVSQSSAHSRDMEPVRLNVKRVLKEHLSKRMDQTKESDYPKLDIYEIEEFANTTEEEMYKLFNKNTGSKYRAKYRSLIFNIKDQKNETLFQKICQRVIHPKQLVRMSPEELASQELAEWRQNETKHQLEMIKKSELDLLSCAKNYVLKTHKGEEVIEGKITDRVNLDVTIPVEDVVTVLNESNVKGITSKFQPLEQIENSNQNVDVISKRKLGSEKNVSNDIEQNKIKKDLDKQSKHKDKQKEKHKKSNRSQSKGRDSRHKSPHRDHRTHRDHRSYREHRDHRDSRDHREHRKDQISNKSNQKKDKIDNSKSVTNYLKQNREQEQSKLEEFSLIDQILKSAKTVEEAANLVNDTNSENQTPMANTSTSSTISLHAQMTTKLRDVVPVCESEIDSSNKEEFSIHEVNEYEQYYLDQSPTIWSGNINMIDVASFRIIIQPVDGSFGHLNKEMPQELDVVGRISPDTVWDYISKIKKSPNKEIVIVRLLPINQAENDVYSELFQYLDKRKRLGVVKMVDPGIKDFYIMPLQRKQLMPSVLKINNTQFYNDVLRPELLMGVIVRVLGRTKRLTDSFVIKETQQSNEPQEYLSRKTKRLRNDDDCNISKSSSPFADFDPDLDAIIKAPIDSKVKMSSRIDLSDGDEPYSPGDSSDDGFKNFSRHKNSLDREMEELNRKIEEREREIEGLSQIKHGNFTSIPDLEKIALPPNLSQILASITAQPGIVVPPPPPTIGSLVNIENRSIHPFSTSMSVPYTQSTDIHLSASTSRLAQLSEAELLSLVPDNIEFLQNDNCSGTKYVSALNPPPEKKPRWEEPPPPGMEDEYL